MEKKFPLKWIAARRIKALRRHCPDYMSSFQTGQIDGGHHTEV
jgi:hypothetical protein